MENSNNSAFGSLTPSTRSVGKRVTGGASTYSSSISKNRQKEKIAKEDGIKRKIDAIFSDKYNEMITEIWETINDDKRKQYLL